MILNKLKRYKRVPIVLVTMLLLASFGLPLPVSASISAGNSSNLDQANFRWRYDNESESAATWRDVVNTGITNISITETSLRIRFHTRVPSNRVSVAVSPRLEFSSNATTCTDGSWTIIGAQGSGSVFRLKASSWFTDAANTTQQISADTFITGKIYESTQTGASVSLTGNVEGTEHEWSIETNSPSYSTTYRFRVSNAGTAYGSYTNCATLQTQAAVTAPTVTTSAATNVSIGSATLNGLLTATGGATPTVRGFAYGTNSTLSSGTATTTESGSFGTGAFPENVSGLFAGVTYYFRAYATNSNGTGIANNTGSGCTNGICSFTTGTKTTVSRKMRLFEGFKIKFASGKLVLHQTDFAYDIPSVTTNQIATGCSIEATLKGTITDTGGKVSLRGFAWSTDPPLTDVNTSTTTEYGNFNVGEYAKYINGLTEQTVYYYRAYATSTTGTGYGSILNFTTPPGGPC